MQLIFVVSLTSASFYKMSSKTI